MKHGMLEVPKRRILRCDVVGSALVLRCHTVSGWFTPKSWSVTITAEPFDLKVVRSPEEVVFRGFQLAMATAFVAMSSVTTLFDGVARGDWKRVAIGVPLTAVFAGVWAIAFRIFRSTDAER